ncbi:MAG: glycosyltransferase [Candidatus Omnitrophica bacterium]|nr:glycosyltransferase [Candidatus Omnitrophota bacterium]
MMKIAIINIAFKGVSGGYKKYLLNIVPRLASDPRIEALLCVFPEVFRASDWFKPLSKVAFVNYSSYSLFSRGFDKWLNQRINKFSPDVIFVPVEKPVKFNNIPVVTMIQNMEPFVTNVERKSLAETARCFLQTIFARQAVKSSARIIALSRFEQDFLVNKWHVPINKIDLVYHGFSLDDNLLAERPKNIPIDWGNGFLFTAGSIRPARGLEDLILAVKNINFSSLGIKGVVIAGESIEEMLPYKQRLLDLIKDSSLSGFFVFLDKINPAQMAWCYQNCRAFIMTSRVESFGMIGVEAMAYGCVCVAADNPPLPEIFRDAAFYYHSKDDLSLAWAIQDRLSLNDTRRQEVSQKAKKAASRFSWGICAEKTMAVLSNALYRW